MKHSLFATLILGLSVAFSGCSTVSKYAYRSGFEGWDGENLEHLSRADKKFYDENRDFLTRDEWSHWLFEEDKTKREAAWKKHELDVILAERKAKDERPGAKPEVYEAEEPNN